MANILTDEQIAAIAEPFDIVTIPGMLNHEFARAIERAVLEAAPASSAMAMQAVDATKQLKVIIAELIDGYRCEDSESRQVFRMPADFPSKIAKLNASLQSQQSPVQAGDAGRQG